ncbi:MAG: DUF362 domain-containing protein [Thermoproteota archaeon]
MSSLKDIACSFKQFIKKLAHNTYVIGIISLLWFLYRTGTKPSRATYPCQKAALVTSYNFLIFPVICFLAGVANKLGLKLTRPANFLKSKSTERATLAILIVLASSSVLLYSVLLYANFASDVSSLVRQRTSLNEKLATVSVVRVEEKSLEAALEEAINYLGGIESIVPEGAKVLIKPNLVRNQAPPDTTRPDIVEALINIIKKRNPSIIWIAEGSGEQNTMDNFRALGYFEVAERTGAILVDLNYGELVEVPVEDGGFVFNSFTFNKVLTEADVFISVPAMKTHYTAVVTLGMKNLVGIAPGAVYSRSGWANKWRLHEEAADRNDVYLGGVITDLCTARRINLTIIDGRVAMEGEGPHDGTPVNLGLIIAGRDPVATDSVASFIMGFDPEKIPTLVRGNQRRLGTNNLHNIEVKGESIEQAFHPFQCATGHESFQLSFINLFPPQLKTTLTIATIVLFSSTVSLALIRRKVFAPRQVKTEGIKPS